MQEDGRAFIDTCNIILKHYVVSNLCHSKAFLYFRFLLNLIQEMAKFEQWQCDVDSMETIAESGDQFKGFRQLAGQ
jgi:hypothetical protein